jgi:signal transduction histidine kinase
MKSSRKRSLIFRYALIYTALFCATSLAILGFLYWSTFALDQGRVDAEISAEAALLQEKFSRKGVAEIKTILARRSSDRPGASTIYMLATQRLEWVAGNLQVWPDGEPAGQEMVEFPLGETSERARGRTVELPDGLRLLVGRNLGEGAKFRDLILQAMLGAFGLTFVLGIAGGLLVGRRVSSRLEEINQNSAAILAGDFTRRMPVGSGGDEFDDLSENLNRMLDRIEGLVEGMRSVSDEIAHDLRSPISRLKSRIEVALLTEDDMDAYRSVLQETVVEADRILSIFNALLAITLAESGAERERFQDVDLDDMAADVVDTYEPLASETGLALERESSGQALVRGEPHLLAQALANLLDNAIKYVPAGGRIVIRLERTEEAQSLVVEDNGPGMPEDFRDRAFERFSRADSSRTQPGSGLGLSLVRAVAHLHGGEVLLEDAGPGLRASLILPLGTP